MKTAKEIAENCKLYKIVSTVANKNTKILIEYSFTPGEFNGFCHQLLKEQRILCAMNLMTKSEVKIYPEDYEWFKDIIENTPNPKFE